MPRRRPARAIAKNSWCCCLHLLGGRSAWLVPPLLPMLGGAEELKRLERAVADLEMEMSQEGFWDDNAAAKATLREV